MAYNTFEDAAITWLMNKIKTNTSAIAALKENSGSLNITIGGNWFDYENGLKIHYYEGADITTYKLPSENCFILVIQQSAGRGIAVAIEWAGGTSGSTNMWLNRLHDDTSSSSWAGWTQIADLLSNLETSLAAI